MIRTVLRWLRRTKLARAIHRFAERVSLPGFEGHSLYEVSMFFVSGINKGGMKTRAASMAYHFFLALFPTIIFLFTLIPYIPIQHFQERLFELIQQLLPENSFKAMHDTIDGIINRQNSGLLSIGFVAALYFSTGGMTAMMSAFNRSIHIRERRPGWKQQIIALALVLVLTILIVAVVSLIVGSELLLRSIVDEADVVRMFVIIGRWFMLGLFFIVVIGIYYRYGPSQRMHKHLISPGTILATVLIILTSIGFAWFIDNFGRYNALYGSIGSIIVFLLFIFYNSMMLLVGFELDASISEARFKRKSLLELQETKEQQEDDLDDEKAE
jgi:membrane protein